MNIESAEFLLKSEREALRESQAKAEVLAAHYLFCQIPGSYQVGFPTDPLGFTHPWISAPVGSIHV